MIKNVLSDIGGVGIYGVISICLFFTVFSGAILVSLMMSRRTARTLSELPLDDGEKIFPPKGVAHE
ncbi:MAG: CcoQ/FixQ family Cbb3-type cytochrome c oxidase assembly chaperone [Verrucomicrobia bacterium]|nr:CcoQ/FixQ family Cbb3-type cytochrome c oxidase assembly chaperone [Verrucomicrobiota bacterium]